jgi:hypothetical protein
MLRCSTRSLKKPDPVERIATRIPTAPDRSVMAQLVPDGIVPNPPFTRGLEGRRRSGI